jgi:uncharacterized protein (UPF0303 family)
MAMSRLEGRLRRGSRRDSVSDVGHRRYASVADSLILVGAVIAIRLFDGQQLFTCVVGKPGATSEYRRRRTAKISLLIHYRLTRQLPTTGHGSTARKPLSSEQERQASSWADCTWLRFTFRSEELNLVVPDRFDAQGRKPEDKGFPFPQYACHGGGYPIWLKNNSTGPIGTILVSGLPQAEDHQVSAAG